MNAEPSRALDGTWLLKLLAADATYRVTIENGAVVEVLAPNKDDEFGRTVDVIDAPPIIRHGESSWQLCFGIAWPGQQSLHIGLAITPAENGQLVGIGKAYARGLKSGRECMGPIACTLTRLVDHPEPSAN